MCVLVYRDLGYDKILGMLIEVSSYVDICIRYRYFALSRQFILGIGIPQLFSCRYFDS
jgi:hypothetical protein